MATTSPAATQLGIVSVPLSARELATCRSYAKAAEIGGSSNIRAHAERMGEIKIDQLVGQLGTLALAKWLKGTCEGHAEYARGREIANRNPTSGDNGADVIGSNIDVKTSLCRYPGKSLFDYNLLVRPREYHPGWVYLLALCEADLEADCSDWQAAQIHLMGWVASEELPEPGGDERFGDARVVPAYKLHRLPPLRWAF